MMHDASPDYGQAAEDIAAEAAAQLSDGARTISPRTVVLTAVGALIAGGLICGAAGVAIASASAPTVTEVLPLAEACATAIAAAEDFITADADLDAALAARDEAHAAYWEATLSGTGEDIDDTFARLDDAKTDLAGVEDARAAAERTFRDGNNRCLTDVEAARTEVGNRG